jgi:hypothetical protein
MMRGSFFPMADDYSKPREYTDPTSINEALRRRVVLIEQIDACENQLGDKQRKHEMLKRDYEAWRAKTLIARSKYLNTLRLTNLWIAEFEEAKQAADPFGYSPVEA